MGTEILFRNKRLRNLALIIAVETRFEAILAVLNEIQIQNVPVKAEHIHYAILELINNSLRAQKETRRSDRIRLEYRCRDGLFYFCIRDAGGGFDPRDLPYDLYQPVERINTNGQAFLDYREKHEYQRFGLGLYAVKKIFTKMKVTFLDTNKAPMDWQPGSVYGTSIEGYLAVTQATNP